MIWPFILEIADFDTVQEAIVANGADLFERGSIHGRLRRGRVFRVAQTHENQKT
jgi:5-carboxymethyl-2-hydroxymuconate isomerase